MMFNEIISKNLQSIWLLVVTLWINIFYFTFEKAALLKSSCRVTKISDSLAWNLLHQAVAYGFNVFFYLRSSEEIVLRFHRRSDHQDALQYQTQFWSRTNCNHFRCY